MGRKALSAADKLVMVGGAVPPIIKSLVNKMAKAEHRTASQIVRLLLEESPRVKSALRKNGKK